MFCKTKTKPKVSEKKGQPVRVSFEKKLLLTELLLYFCPHILWVCYFRLSQCEKHPGSSMTLKIVLKMF